jgi:hypothetical protein
MQAKKSPVAATDFSTRSMQGTAFIRNFFASIAEKLSKANFRVQWSSKTVEYYRIGLLFYFLNTFLVDIRCSRLKTKFILRNLPLVFKTSFSKKELKTDVLNILNCKDGVSLAKTAASSIL